MMNRSERLRVTAWAGVSLLAAGVRLWLACSAPLSVDIHNYGATLNVLASGRPLYEAADRYNYTPVWSFVLRGAYGVSQATGVGLGPVIRLLLLAVDLACAALLFGQTREGGPAKSWRTAGLYLANPVGIWVSAVQGQFDVIALVFLVAALGAARRREAEAVERSPAPQMAWLSLSVAFKHVTFFHPILFVRRRRDWPWLALPYAATAALFLPYAKQWRAIRDRVLLYRSVPRSYGFSEFVLYDTRAAKIVLAVAVAAALAAAFWLRKFPPERGALILFLVLLFFAPGFGSQYLLWPLTLGAARPTLGYFALTVSGAVWILGSHFGWPGSEQFMGQLVWLCVALWAVREIQSLPPREPDGA